MAAEVPRRPRLADHVLARRHVVDGREFVVLHDEARRETLELEPATWAVLSCADGTRDMQGVAAAARRLGAGTDLAPVVALFSALAARDLLIEGAPEHEADGVRMRERDEATLSLPVASLPGYRYACDGRGGCCRSYESVLLTPEDAQRATAALQGHRIASLPSSRWFTPDRGSAPTPLRVPACVDGGCGFLGDDGRCEIHRRIGLSGKPTACASFPVTACSDGVEVRVSVTPECTCVLRPVADDEGEPVGVGWAAGRDVPPMLVIDALPETIDVDGVRSESRAWLRERVGEVFDAVDVAPDPAALCWSSADAWSESVPIDLGPYVEPLLARAKDAMARRATYSAASDWVLRSMRWLVGTLRLLTDDGLRAMVVAPTQRADALERRYVRAVLWGYQGFDDACAAEVLRMHAAKIWIARAMGEVPLGPPEIAPLAVLSMLLRGHLLSNAWDSQASASPTIVEA